MTQFLPALPGLADVRVRLFLTSGTLLFVELLLIRWIPSEVIYIGFFSNFVLMGSFLGIGLGIIAGRNGRRLPLSPFALLLFGVVLLIYQAQLNVQVKSPDELFFGLAESTSANINFLVLPFVFLLVTGLMAALALPLGPLLKSLPPLRPTPPTSWGRWPASWPSPPCRRPARTRSSGSAWWPSCCSSWPWARASRPGGW